MGARALRGRTGVPSEQLARTALLWKMRQEIGIIGGGGAAHGGADDEGTEEWAEGAKENDEPRASPIAKKAKKPRQSLSKRVSFGHVELHTFLKDGDRTPSPMPPPHAEQHTAASPREEAVQAAHAASRPALAPAFAPRPVGGGDAAGTRPPQLADLLREEDEPAPADAVEEEDDDVVFQPRGAAEGMTMEFTMAYGAGIQEVFMDPRSSSAHEGKEEGVPMEFTRNYGGILSGADEGAEPMDKDEAVEAATASPLAEREAPRAPPTELAAAEPLSYDGFLANHGITFLDEMVHRQRASLADAPDGDDALRCFSQPEQREEALIVAAACVRPEVESAQWGAEQLEASCDQIRAAIAQTEEQVRLAAATWRFESLETCSDELHALKALCRNGALAMWHEWRSKLEASNAKVLADSQDHLLADLAKLHALLHAVRDAHASARADAHATSLATSATESERKLAAAQDEVKLREAAVRAASKRAAGARAAVVALRAGLESAEADARPGAAPSVRALAADEAALGAKLLALRASLDEVLAAAPEAAAASAAACAAESRSNARARAQETALLWKCIGWRPLTLTSSELELSFGAGVSLKTALAAGANDSLRLRGAPLIERRAREGEADGVGAMLLDLALCEAAKHAAGC
ncbi:hypothetical protein T492DRAFT_886106, partial [Pavlovales sp. CCMP2436]